MIKAFTSLLLFLCICSVQLYAQSSSSLYKEGVELRENGKKNKAIKKIEEALSKAKSERNLTQQMACHIQLAEMMDNVISYKDALSHYKSFTDLYKKQSLEQTAALEDSVRGIHVNIQANTEEISAQGKELDSLTTQQIQSEFNITNPTLDKDKHVKEIKTAKYRRNFLL